MRRFALALALLLFCAVPARALTVENATDAVLYCSVYRQGYAMPLTQFVLLPGKSIQWSPVAPTSSPLVLRAMPEPGSAKPAPPAALTLVDHSATVVADRQRDALVLATGSSAALR